MQSLGITRNVWESDMRVEPNWWLGESICDYCLFKNTKVCDYCAYRKSYR